MPLEAAELLALALALDEDDVPDERAVEELAAGAEGSAVVLTAAHAHATSLARALPYDGKAQRTVALLQQALKRVTTSVSYEHPPDDAESWLRAGRSRRPSQAGEDTRTVSGRLARLAAGAGDDTAGVDDTAAELDRLRAAAVEEVDERRRSRWWRP